MNFSIKLTALLCTTLAAMCVPTVVIAQASDTRTPAGSTSDAKKEPPAPAEQKVSLDLQNAPIREALEKLFRQTKSDFSLDGSVQGYVTLKVTDQPLESALRLIIARATVPLTYTKESGVYFIKPRRTRQSSEAAEVVFPEEMRSRGGSPSERTLIADQDGNRLLAVSGGLNGGGQAIDIIHLTYLDPADIAEVFNIIQIPTFSRQMGPGGTGSRGPGSRN
jgi:hypothetical protein